MDAALEYQGSHNYTDTWFPNGSRNSRDISSGNTSDHERENNSYKVDALDISILIICILGAAGNGIVIWLLGFRVQRNPFMTYILNLGIADLGLLTSDLIFRNPFANLPKSSSGYILLVSDFLCLLTYSAGQFLLTAISIDRCVAIFFPLWHRCHRPPCLPAIVCALMWLLSFLLSTITCTFLVFNQMKHLLFQFIANAALCLPLVTISTLALFIKVCFKQRQYRRGKMLTILLLTLAFFLLFAFPFNVIFIFSFYCNVPEYLPKVTIILACLNSSVNPVIYFLIGRQRKTRHRQSLKMILQRAFKEEEGCTDSQMKPNCEAIARAKMSSPVRGKSHYHTRFKNTL